MQEGLAHRVDSANSFTELGRALATDARLAQALGTFCGTFDDRPVADLVLRFAGPQMSVRAFLDRRDLHRGLATKVPYAQLLAAFKRTFIQGGAHARALEEAGAFSDLLPFVQAGEAGRRRVAHMVHELSIRPGLRKLVGSFAGTDTVEKFLERADDEDWSEIDYFEVLDAFVGWVGEREPATLSNVISLSSKRPSTSALLEERIRQTGIPDLMSWTVAMLEGQRVDAYSITVRALLASSLPEVDRRLTAFEARLAALRQNPLPQLPEVQDPTLSRIQAAAAAERTRLAPQYPHGLVTASVRIGFTFPDLRFDVATGNGYHAEQVWARGFSTWPQAPQLKCTCTHPVCVHRVAVLDGLCGPWVVDEKISVVLLAASRPAWAVVLDAIGAAPVRERKQGVLSFTLSPDTVDFQFHELGKRGPSAKGKRVVPEHVLGRLEGLDHRIAERLALADVTQDRADDRQLGDALLLLVGHPRVRWENDPAYRPVARAEGTVKVEETATGFRFRFLAEGQELDQRVAPYLCTGGAVVLLRARDGRILVTFVSEQFLRLAAATLQLGPELPREAAPRLVELLPALEAGAAVELPDDLRGQELEPSERVLVRVAPAGTGLSLSIRVEPLERGPAFVPGQGVPVSASFDGQRRTFTRRTFDAELAAANTLAATLGLDPTIAVEPYAWLLDGSDRHVETLRRLSTAGVPVEWLAPKVKFTGEAQLDRLRLSITRKRDWFGLEGEVTVDDRRVALAALLEAARERRRFVRLAEGEFAQLSEAMVDALAPLAHLGAPGAPAELTLGTAPLIDALAPQLESLDAAREWKALMARLAEAKTTRFAVPRGLKAKLRDYQVEGFEWLSRLAQWGVGACLADDMGLGKTLQALALLLSRAKKGPALVVAPSSVLHTWRAEADKFAPGLNLTLFHEGDRALGSLAAGDVVVVSWSLLAREAELFAGRRFSTVVFDEAHAIKNADTQRAKAAHQLQADFVVALSGTPIENHVGELWSLFKAVMPALLGSEESFRRRFGSGQKEALQALSTLIRPFVLRRTKSAVAKELPSRTELEVVVPLSAEERALYDDVRLAAVADLGDVTGESKRFDVLAALTRLRLTACHPKLVDPGWKGPASKLSRLLELLKDLSSSGHRVLVFSQFTKHLALVVDALRVEGITFSYLDGQVPVAERARRVEAFQAGGGGDVFLVSLKAGGTGLTLTAADYVIHLDPWWNPAVEDQASDRAHRIGQSRPVTVYRLISEGTIEQQILSMHQDKRELVDALLSGADTAGKLSTAQLAELIRSA